MNKLNNKKINNEWTSWCNIKMNWNWFKGEISMERELSGIIRIGAILLPQIGGNNPAEQFPAVNHGRRILLHLEPPNSRAIQVSAGQDPCGSIAGRSIRRLALRRCRLHLWAQQSAAVRLQSSVLHRRGPLQTGTLAPTSGHPPDVGLRSPAHPRRFPSGKVRLSSLQCRRNSLPLIELLLISRAIFFNSFFV